MKPTLEKVNVMEEAREEFHLGATIMVILLFLTFLGTSFYILVDTYA